MNKLTIKDIASKKGKDKITMLTCYDYSFAAVLNEAGVDIVLVGDSLANVVLGFDDTRKAPLTEMVSHTRAVARACDFSLVVSDMPFSALSSRKKAVSYAKKFISQGVQAVKVEWFSGCETLIAQIIKNKIPVMGHIGLTPQTAHLLGGYKVQGKDKISALALVKQAKIIQELGAFSIVLECIPRQLAQFITEMLKIPTIGIGAGKFCDGQVLVLYDFIGLYKKVRPRFVRTYADLFSQLKEIALKFANDIKANNFPSDAESYSIDAEELKGLIPLHIKNKK
jgi:3-methyl-2-oxobutanoate hydroxymethyltransferase